MGDNMFNEKYYLNLKTQKPINYNGLLIYQPSLNEIIELDLEYYNSIMSIYSLNVDCFDVKDNSNINFFEDIILCDNYLLSRLAESLRILTKADEIYYLESDKSILLNFYKKDNPETFESSFKINSSNYDDICEIILKINSNKKIVIEKPPANLTPRQLDVWKKLHEGRTRDSKKNEIHIYDILNICEFGGGYFIPIEEICKWSLWRIANCYKSKVGYKTYEDNLQIALVSGDDKTISGENHWHQQLMIRE